jgi:two-component system response regulator AtoC
MAKAVRRVLIVDDDAIIGGIIGQLLRRLDYVPQQTPSPITALDILRREPGFLFIVCDVQMPGLNGPDLIRKVAAEQSGLRVLFASGYPMDDLRRTPIPGVIHRCLDKPFTLAQFARGVHDLLTTSRDANDAVEGQPSA